MKVMCIKNGRWVSNITGTTSEMNPVFGEICTVSAIYKYYYRLLEYLIDESGNEQEFHKSQFIPLSEIDELELVNLKTETI